MINFFRREKILFGKKFDFSIKIFYPKIKFQNFNKKNFIPKTVFNEEKIMHK